MGDFLEIANSSALFIIVSVVLLMVSLQAVLFIRVAIKRSRELGISRETVRKVIVNSAVFSILPSLPIIITMIIMMNALGIYLPWLRLSVMGSAMYESMAANIAITTLGFEGLGDLNITKSAFVSIIWVMTLGVAVGATVNTLFLKKYDTSLKKIISKRTGFTETIITALFIGFIAVFATPNVLNFEAPISMVVFYISGAACLGYNLIAKKANIKIFAELSFPMALLSGLAAAVLYAYIFP